MVFILLTAEPGRQAQRWWSSHLPLLLRPPTLQPVLCVLQWLSELIIYLIDLFSQLFGEIIDHHHCLRCTYNILV